MQIFTAILNAIVTFINSQAPDQILDYIIKAGNLTIELIRNVIGNFIN